MSVREDIGEKQGAPGGMVLRGEPVFEMLRQLGKIDGEGYGFADFSVGKGLSSQVILDEDMSVQVGERRGSNSSEGIAPIEALEERGGGERVDVHASADHRGGDFRLVPKKTVDDAVEQRSSGQEKMGITLQPEFLIRDEGFQHERSRAYRMQVGGMDGQGRAVVVNVSGQNRYERGDQYLGQDGVGAGESDQHGVRVRRLHGGHGFQHGMERMVALPGEDGKGHVLGGDGDSVVKRGVLPQPEKEREAIPAFRP